ncbi:dienelactone hydrolase family protein [Diaphorobacter sp. JS3050]|uniref:dienelactone hydrolase family protein n=1 Tax=Diaphorobacter sp. JS3050 TaxID=2735554 RepID=UPI000EB77BEE|nr:dienelactone hydrolase family protein [Diaphorobacter sp. JS3050]AYE88728.1 chlorodienelactone hydrolase [Diaphorobacter sp.]QJY33128.1 dienelactone hydrolase family protein [Diaphorobacter sp. JS3050]
MTNFNFEIPSGHGFFDGYLTSKDGPARPGIVLLPEIFGANNAMRMAADQFADAGFVVLVPDLFNQLEPRIELGYSDAERTRAIGLWQKMDEGVGLADCYAAVDALKAHPNCDGRLSVLGFCLGGKFALHMAAAGGIDACISFYPVRVQDYADTLHALKCPTQVHVGDQDAHIPIEVQNLLKGALDAPGQLEFHLYEGAGHGFFNSVRAFGYASTAAKQSFEASLAFLNRNKR